mgnify:CR=1 FL=1
MKDDASVSVGVNLNTGKADKELQRLEQKVLKLQEDLTVGKSKKGALTAELEQAQKALAELQAQTKIEGGKAIISPENVTKISAMQEKITSVQAAIEKQNQSLKNTQMELDGVKLRYGEVSQKAQELAAAESGSGTEKAAKGKLASVLQSFTGSADVPKLQTVLSGLAAGFKEIASAALSAGKTVTKGFLSAAGNGLKKLVSLAGRAGKAFLNLFKTAGKTNGAFGGGIKNMLRYALGLRGLYALFGKLRAAMTEGFKNLAQFSSGTNKSLSNLKSSLTQLKNALATAFAPILQTIEPILTRFINMLSKAADYIARFTAALTGKSSYTRATKVQEDYAKSIEGTGAAAEDASKGMAKFDEINQITTKDTSSGGGGSSETSPADMFETVAIEPLDFASWGEAFSAMLDKILVDGIPKLKEAFASFADWLNGFSSKLYEAFTFPGVLEKVSQLGRDLANAFNGLVDQINWTSLGAALGAGLNLAIAFLVNFIYTFDWMKLGAKLAEMFNAMVSEIDWYSVGMLLWAKFKIALETLAGFLLNVDMKELAHAASQLIIGFFDSMSDTIQSIDWQALGHQIAEFLANIDWAGVADSFFEAIGSALGGLAAFLWGLIEDAWNSVVDWWHEVAYEDGKFTIKGLLNGIADALKSIGQWIKEHIFQPFIDGFKKAFGIASPSKVMAEQGGYIITGLLNGIKAGLQPIIDLFTMLKENAKKVLQGIIEFVSGVFTGDWEKAWNGIQEIFKGVWNGIVGLLEGAVNLIIDGVNWLISKLNMVSFTTPDWLDVIKPGLGGKTFGISIPNIERVALPRLATGAVIPPNREFLAVLGDQKRGTNVEAPADLIRQMVREELRAYGGGIGNRQQTVILQVDHRELGRVVYQLNNEETQRVGVRLAGAKA